MNFQEKYKLTSAGQKESRVGQLIGTTIPSGAYDDGLITLLPPDSGPSYLQFWQTIVQRSVTVLATTGFGDLFFREEDNGRICFLETQRAAVEPIDFDLEWFLEDFLCNEEIRDQVLRARLLQELSSIKGPLQSGQCFILEPWPILGGVDKPENYAKGDTSIYLSLVGQAIA